MRADKLFTHICILYACIIRVACHYNGPIDVQLWDAVKTPLHHMVDVTNEFGLKVLYEHNFLNKNNVAFSPYGLTGILVALFEGVTGDSSFQIQRTVQLPWNRNVLRIGFRDIHRTLKTYFIPEEGFLAGLALNNENVTFKEEYRNVLRFYGFDLESNQLPTMPPRDDNGTSTTIPSMPESTPEANPNREETTPSNSLQTNSVEQKEPTSLASTTTKPIVETVVVSAAATTPAPTTVPTVAVMMEASTGAPTTEANTRGDTTLVSETTSTTALSPTPEIVETTEITPQSESPPSKSESVAEITSAINDDIEVITTASPSSTASAPTNAPAVNEMTPNPSASGDLPATTPMPTTTSIPSTTSMPTTTPMSSSITAMPTMSQTTEVATENTAAMAETSTTDANIGTPPTTSTLETLQRRKKSIVDFILDQSWLDRSHLFEEHLYERPIDIFSDETPRFSNDRMFLANGHTNVEVTYMTYDTILEYTYLPHLKASALRLPLDNNNYYLLVVLPDYEFELNQLIKQLAQESNLRDIYSSLQPRYVHACVPSFMVKGFVTLTSDLQRLGIRDAFEPRQNDFTPMTDQKGVYVRNVEQAITVTIRKYENKTQQQSRYVVNQFPVRFSATYPFLYFVMDSTIHVALMAGKLLDPLNTRIL